MVTNDINQELLDHDIGPSDDSVFHIAEAISASALKVEDKYLKSKEGELSVEEAEGQISFIVCNAKKDIKSMPLVELSDLLKQYNIPLKRATTKLLAEFCENSFNVIKYHKDIQKCVNDLSNALFEYNNHKDSEKCKKIINIKEKLRKAIELSGNRSKSANHVLDLVFVRSAVDKFYKKLGNLDDHKVLRDLKFTFNSLGSDIVNLSREGTILSGGHIKGLIYGFGFYPSSVDISINNLSEKSQEVKISTDLKALASLSKEYVLTINGKNFEVLNTGSRNDRNCAFRAIAVGYGLGPNGYNIVQEKVIEGAQKVRDMWDKLPPANQDQIFEMLKGKVCKGHENEAKKEDFKKLMEEYISSRKNGFVSGMRNIEILFAATGLKRPICVVDIVNKNELTFYPLSKDSKGKDVKENVIHKNYIGYDEPIYIARTKGHFEALLPSQSGGSQGMIKTKASGAEKAISNYISNFICKVIKEGNSKLFEIMINNGKSANDGFIREFLNDKECKNDKKLFVAMKILNEIRLNLGIFESADEITLEREISYIARCKAYKMPCNYNLYEKSKKLADIFASKAVKLCEENPLFWDNAADYMV